MINILLGAYAVSVTVATIVVAVYTIDTLERMKKRSKDICSRCVHCIVKTKGRYIVDSKCPMDSHVSCPESCRKFEEVESCSA